MIDEIVSKMMSVPSLYQAVQNSIARPLHEKIKENIMKIIPDKVGVRILDIGCGTGDYASLFKNSSYLGVDIDPVYVDSAKKEFGKNRENINFEVADAILLPFLDSSFDYCISVGLYHHISDDGVIESLRSALCIAGEGNVIIFDAIFPSTGNSIGHVLRLLDRGKFVRTYSAYEELILNNFKVKEIYYSRAGFLDYIYYRL